MPTYILLSRLSADAQKRISQNPETLRHIRQTLETWEAKILHDFQLMGKYDHCTIFEISDNFKAQRAILQQELSDAEETQLLPAIDLPLFQRLISERAQTAGPHPWQINTWAKLARLGLRWYTSSRWVRQGCQPLTVSGKEHFHEINGPCIIVANRVGQLAGRVLFHCLPQSIKWNIYFEVAADRFFVKGRKQLTMQPWYQSLAMGSFPFKRGGGAKQLDYCKWLLEKGCHLGIFWEGTGSRRRKLARFKHSVAILAIEKGVPVVPVYLTGFDMLRHKEFDEITPVPAGAHIQPPLYFSEGTSVPEATRQIYDSLNDIQRRVQKYGPEAARYDWDEDLLVSAT